MKIKRNIKAIPERDRCQTPPYALDPLIPFLLHDARIWESCEGEGYIKKELSQRGYDVIGSDLLHGQDYFKYQPDTWSLQVTNPPYSIKYDWLARAYQLGKPFALLMPIDVLGSARAQRMFKNKGIEIILLDKRIGFKMPQQGWGGSPHFNTAWYTWGLEIGAPLSYGKITPRPACQGHLLADFYKCASPGQPRLW